MARNRIIEARLIDAMRSWPSDEKLTVRALAKAIGQPHLIVGKVVDAMRMAGMIVWDELKLSPSLAAANDDIPVSRSCRADDVRLESRAKADDEAAGGRTSEPAVESVSRPAAGRSAAATFEALSSSSPAASGCDVDVTAGETAPVSNAAPVSGGAEQAGGGGATASPPADSDARAERVLAHLTGIADAGAPCPRNGEISAACDMPLHHVVKAVERLIDRGLLRREVGSARKFRRFEIVASGRMTGWPEPDRPIGTVDGPRDALAAREAEDAALAARRDAVVAGRAQTIADAVKAEAEARGRNRAAARSTGSVVMRKGAPAAGGLTIGGQVQMERLRDGPGAGIAVLREAWPEAMRMLERIAVARGERPIPLMAALIGEEFARLGLRRNAAPALPHAPGWGGSGRMVDDGFDDLEGRG